MISLASLLSLTKGVTKCDTPKTYLYFAIRGRINDSAPHPASLYPNSQNHSTDK